jgi:hypothetical protein
MDTLKSPFSVVFLCAYNKRNKRDAVVKIGYLSSEFPLCVGGGIPEK